MNITKTNNNSIAQKFTEYLNRVFSEAQDLAFILNSPEITPEHLFYSISLVKGSLGKEILEKVGIETEKIKTLFFPADQIFYSQNSKKTIIQRNKIIQLSILSQKILVKTVLIAAQNQHKYIGTEHLLLALVQTESPFFKKLWKEKKIDIKSFNKQLKDILKATSKFSELISPFEYQKIKDFPKIKKDSALNFFCTDLTDSKIQKSIDPVIGREEEINRMIDILSRRTKNNPILIGEPGVGKTAIVEGLAKRILLGQVPDILINKKIFTLDLSTVVAGASFRGEFEIRFKQIIEEVKRNSNIILFIDEIHTLVGAGNVPGSLDAANILKPALAHGEIHLIGATTLSEYKKYIEEETALERRFQPILVNEPNIETTFQILKGLKNNYETFHQIFITDEALTAACVLSKQFIPSKFLPDKAIDLIDETASRIKVIKTKDNFFKEIRKLENELEIIEEEKKDAILKEDFEKAIILKEQTNKLLDKINELYQKTKEEKKEILGKITEKEIRETISKITKVPIQKLISDEKKQLINLEETLKEKIINQDQAIKEVSECIRCSRLGLMSANRPLSSFLFLGPSGVGKTELAKILAKIIFVDESAFIRIDMSEFSESFNISKLIGAPAGYVGYKESGKLTDTVKTRPYSLILFDEIEKAHPDVLNLLLQVLEDGHLTDAIGRKINFKNTIIVMTSNIGVEKFNQSAQIGFDVKDEKKDKTLKENYKEIKKEILKDLPSRFRPEFLNRLDKILVFQPLNLKGLEKIVLLQIEELNNNLALKNLSLELTNEAVQFIAKKSFAPEQGARSIRKTIQGLIINPIAQKMLEDKFKKNQTIEVQVEKGKLILS
ncbi:ATP-dependent Clp protease ATP-binding subunit ClpC [Candidatus Kuenenbacteria bacterium HGW-Kuenenbacteria-1]|uniref:ATP-dependent Clp protease ATP-binding subunit ClpC n=1 Tax=Candidatus Kuenenbacteria bacterium HGW-Kuenenbacteria-1 TaxID=2013812 RepID=A0A2N1UN31_9BACT|nr:MAG: ATP-dependent Clp protease ATP-binding subunit ClpC [Candidatus Kuenenbacteria bacterium HGW-Kuenenbacteria-1]